jgi:lipopolysaccharide/colanic/teichoic acid biosynthesis glycosyltransferase
MIGYEERAARASARLNTRRETRPSRTSRYDRANYQRAKRAMDVAVTLCALAVLFPVYLAITIALACSDGLPVVFRQKRIGKNGELFDIHKFRTMVKNAEEVLKAHPELWEEYRQTYKIQNDPRISKLGHFLRKSSLDELPQLFNVLRGDMTLVGPRPIVEPEIDMYGDQRHMYIAMKPGCAGLWQCCGRSATTYEERVELDREYYENASLWFDFVILLRTAVAIATGRGAQ